MARRRTPSKRDKNGKFVNKAGINRSKGPNLKNLRKGTPKKRDLSKIKTGLKVAAIVGGTAVVAHSISQQSQKVNSREQRIRARDRIMSREQIRRAATAQNNFIRGVRVAGPPKAPTSASRIFQVSRYGTTTIRRRG